MASSSSLVSAARKAPASASAARLASRQLHLYHHHADRQSPLPPSALFVADSDAESFAHLRHKVWPPAKRTRQHAKRTPTRPAPFKLDSFHLAFCVHLALHLPKHVLPAPVADQCSHTPAQQLEHRAHLVDRLIRMGRIVAAMTVFIEDRRQPNCQAYTARDYQAFVLALRHVIQDKRHMRPRKRGNSGDTGPLLWSPTGLPDKVDPRSLPLLNQCIAAMSEMWTACVNDCILPTNRTASALVATITEHFPPEDLLQASILIVESLQSLRSPLSVEVQLRDWSHGLITSLLVAFGRAGRPEMGEELLHKWALAQILSNDSSAFSPAASTPSTASSSTAAPAPKVALYGNVCSQASAQPALLADICLTGWSQNVAMWNALIRSRCAANDIRGAETWLQRYRNLTSTQEESCASYGLRKPAICSEPYLTLMQGYTELERERLSKIHKVTVQEVRNVALMMQADRVPLNSTVVVFIAQVYVDGGQLAKALSLLEQSQALLGLAPDSQSNVRPDVLQLLFTLHRAIGCLSVGTQSKATAQLARLAPLRFTLQKLIDAGRWQEKGREIGANDYRRVALLNDALDACLTQRDFAAAIVTLNTFESWNLEPSSLTHSCVMHALAIHPIMFRSEELDAGAPQDEVTRSLLSNAEELLALYKAEGGRWAERERIGRLRRMLTANTEGRSQGDEAMSVQFTSTPRSSRGPRELRNVQPLRELLQRAILAENDVDARGSTSGTPESSDASTEGEANPSKTSIGDAQEMLREAIARAKREILDPANDLRARELSRVGGMASCTTSSSPFLRAPFIRQASWSSISAHPSRRGYSTCAGSSSSSDDPLKHADMAPIRVEYLPHQVPYSLGLALQEHLVSQRASARAWIRSSPSPSPASASIEDSATRERAKTIASTDTLLLLQHKPVYTEGRREEKEDEAVATALRKLGADYHMTKRGGQITYHGPGQLVGYPILDIGAMGLSTRCYVDAIQNSLKSMLANRFGLETVPPPEEHTGVWADEFHKIGSIGIQVRHRITSHGFALNVEQRSMRGFQHIVACGIKGRGMTCIEQELGRKRGISEAERKTEMQEVVDHTVGAFGETFGRKMRWAEGDSEFRYEFGEEDEVERALRGLRIDKHRGERFVRRIWVDGAEVVVAAP